MKNDAHINAFHCFYFARGIQIGKLFSQCQAMSHKTAKRAEQRRELLVRTNINISINNDKKLKINILSAIAKQEHF